MRDLPSPDHMKSYILSLEFRDSVNKLLTESSGSKEVDGVRLEV